MRTRLAILAGLFMAVGVVVPAAGQFGPTAPRIPGVWSPEVGSGTAYVFEGKGQPKREIEFAVVGTETFQGKPGHWLETAVKDPREGLVIMKVLMVESAGMLQPRRVIVQAPGEGPMEFPMEMMQMQPGRTGGAEPSDFRDKAQRIGTETITTPAGTFECEHWRTSDNGKSADVWFTAQAKPYGVVKMVSAEGTMTLVRVLTNATTRIKGTPKKFDLQEMMRERPE